MQRPSFPALERMMSRRRFAKAAVLTPIVGAISATALYAEHSLTQAHAQQSVVLSGTQPLIKRTDIFLGVAFSGLLYHKSSFSDTWSPWTRINPDDSLDLGGQWTSALVGNTIHLFSKDPTSFKLLWLWSSDTQWSWTTIPQPAAASSRGLDGLAATSQGDGSLDLFGVDNQSPGHVYHTHGDNGQWSDWSALNDSTHTNPSIFPWMAGMSSWGPGRTDLFETLSSPSHGLPLGIYHKFYDQGAWSTGLTTGDGWENLGMPDGIESSFMQPVTSVSWMFPLPPLQGTYHGSFTVGSVSHGMTVQFTQSGTALTGTADISGPWISPFTLSGTVNNVGGLTIQATNTDRFGIIFFGGIHGPGYVSGIATADNGNNGSWTLNQDLPPAPTPMPSPTPTFTPTPMQGTYQGTMTQDTTHKQHTFTMQLAPSGSNFSGTLTIAGAPSPLHLSGSINSQGQVSITGGNVQPVELATFSGTQDSTGRVSGRYSATFAGSSNFGGFTMTQV